MNKKDYITIIIIFSSVLVAFLIGRLIFSNPGNEVYVTVNNEEVYTTGLLEEKTVQIFDGICRELSDESEFDGRGNLLIVSGGVADVVEADCRDEICVGMKPISNVGESIVCMPNGVIVSVR